VVFTIYNFNLFKFYENIHWSLDKEFQFFIFFLYMSLQIHFGGRLNLYILPHFYIFVVVVVVVVVYLHLFRRVVSNIKQESIFLEYLNK